MKRNKIKKILVVRYEHLGDYSLTIPSIETLHKNFPNVKIDVVVGPWNKELVEATANVNKAIFFDNPLVKRNLTYKNILKIIFFDSFKIMKHICELNKENYDLMINFSDRKFSRILDKMTFAKKKILGTSFPYTGGLESKRIRSILSESLGIKKFSRIGKMEYSNVDNLIVKNLLEEICSKNKKLILIHPISPLKEKNWPIKKWFGLIKTLSDKHKDLLFLFLGAPDQQNEINLIVNPSGIKNLKAVAGKLTLPQFILFISKCDLIIGSDSGPVHFAELTKIPIITLFGHTSDPKRWGPPRGQGRFIKRDDIEKIGIEEVELAFDKLLKLEN